VRHCALICAKLTAVLPGCELWTVYNCITCRVSNDRTITNVAL